MYTIEQQRTQAAALETRNVDGARPTSVLSRLTQSTIPNGAELQNGLRSGAVSHCRSGRWSTAVRFSVFIRPQPYTLHLFGN